MRVFIVEIELPEIGDAYSQAADIKHFLEDKGVCVTEVALSQYKRPGGPHAPYEPTPPQGTATDSSGAEAGSLGRTLSRRTDLLDPIEAWTVREATLPSE